MTTVPTHYSAFSRALHWLVVILMAGMFYTGFTGFGGGPPGGGRPGAGGPGGAPSMTMAMRPNNPSMAMTGGAMTGGAMTGGAMRPNPSMAMTGAPGAGGPPGGPPGGMREQSPFSKIPLHKAMGFTILVLAAVRIIYRLIYRVPEIPSDMAPIQKLAARGVQGLLYFGMLLQPISGWLGSGRAFTFFGIFTMPQIGWLTAYGQQLRWVHTNLDWGLIVLIFLHAVGALYHHYVRQDNVLRSMLHGPRNVA